MPKIIPTPAVLDRVDLLAHITAKITQYDRHILIAAVLEGLRTAIIRGDFDLKDTPMTSSTESEIIA